MTGGKYFNLFIYIAIMSNENNFLKNTANRLGIHNDQILQKATELLRTLNAKGGMKTLNDIAKTVFCLDLACTQFGEPFQKDVAITLSGLKKSVYNNNLNTVEKILGLDKPLTISELSVQMGCTAVKDIAEEIYTSYKNCGNKIKDFTHPQYVAAAVFAACKVKGIKVSSREFASISRLKTSSWKELANEFETFASSIGISQKNKRKKNIEDLKNDIEEITADLENKVVIKKTDAEEEEEEYEVWKERILKEAYEELEKQKVLKNETELTINLSKECKV